MSFVQIRDRLRSPSLRKLALIQILAFGGTLTAFLWTAHATLQHHMREAARTAMLDDMLDLIRIYRREGEQGLRPAANAPHHRQPPALRITTPRGPVTQVEFENAPAEIAAYHWDTLPSPSLSVGETDWHVIKHPAAAGELRVWRTYLGDGSTFWIGRTDAAERQTLSNLMLHLGLIASLALAAIALPIGWFSVRVLTPLNRLSAASSGGNYLGATAHAIPEVNAIAVTLNHSQDRIAALTSELQGVNDHLAHELKTPLARVRANIETLLDHYGTPKGELAASRSLDEIDRASQLVSNILTIRLGATGAMRLHLELTGPFDFISDIVETYTPAAEDRDLNLSLQCDSGPPVLLDRQRMRQAITNLLDNAFAYTPPGGDITVILETTPQDLTILIQDTGPGLSPGEIENIWQRFKRGSAGAGRGDGTGHGLPLVRAIANAHHGIADCRNLETGGAEFRLRLPTAPGGQA